MTNFGKLSAVLAVCFATAVFGACGGGSGGGGGDYSGGGPSYPDCQQYKTGSVVNPDAYASCTATSTSTSTGATTVGSMAFTSTNGITYFHTGTDTNWQVFTGTSTSSK